MSGAVLAIRPRALGDLVLLTPALRALRAGYPDATLVLATEPRFAALAAAMPGVGRVEALERGTLATARLAAHLAGTRWRAVVDFFGNPRTALLASLASTALRAGYELRGRRGRYHVRVPRTRLAEDGRREYAAETHVRLAVAAGGVADGIETRIDLPGSARESAARLFERAGIEEGRAVGVVAAGTWATKTWPPSHYAMLCRRMLGAGWPVLLIGGPGEERLLASLAELAPGARLLPACGVLELAAVLERLVAVVGTDSGPRHLAAALGVPTFAWFGPTHPDNWNPPGLHHASWFTDVPCRGCDRTTCPHWVCMPSLAPDRAADLVLGHLERHAASALGPAARA